MAEHVEDHFGLCPRCDPQSGDTEYLNVRKTVFILCRKHKTYWEFGYGLFSSWTEETQETWDKNAALLETYESVEPVFCRCPECVDRRTATPEPLVSVGCDSEGIPF